MSNKPTLHDDLYDDKLPDLEKLRKWYGHKFIIPSLGKMIIWKTPFKKEHFLDESE